jgi:hypothetical protein
MPGMVMASEPMNKCNSWRISGATGYESKKKKRVELLLTVPEAVLPEDLAKGLTLIPYQEMKSFAMPLQHRWKIRDC